MYTIKEYQEELALRLRKKRQKEGLSLRKLAKKIGIWFSYLHDCEAGRAPIRGKRIERILEYLGVETELYLDIKKVDYE